MKKLFAKIRKHFGMLRDVLLEAVLYVGFAVLVYAFWQINRTAGLFALGAALIIIAILNSIFRE